MRYEHQEMI